MGRSLIAEKRERYTAVRQRMESMKKVDPEKGKAFALMDNINIPSHWAQRSVVDIKSIIEEHCYLLSQILNKYRIKHGVVFEFVREGLLTRYKLDDVNISFYDKHEVDELLKDFKREVPLRLDTPEIL